MRLKGKFYIALVVLFVGLAFFQSSPAVDFSGYAQNYTGILLDDDLTYSSLKNTLSLKLEQTADRTGFLVNPIVTARQGEGLSFDLRQAYVDFYFDTVDIRMGKQQIVWGKSDGVFITDMVSPKDMTDFILPDFEEIRIGVNALKIDRYFDAATIELVWIPAFTPTTAPSSGSTWYIAPSYPLPVQMDTSNQDVDKTLSNSEIFIKASVLAASFDFEIMGGSMWDDNPTPHRTQILVDGTPTIKISPEHHRLTMVGGSFSKPMFGMVLRGESAYYSGKYFASTDTSLAEGVTQKTMIHSLLGLDFSFSSTNMSLQVINQLILDYHDKIAQDENDSIVTFMSRSDFMSELLTVELMAYYHVNDQDSLTRLGVKYNYSDTVNIATGLNVFFGDTGMYGQYDHNDNIYAKITASF